VANEEVSNIGVKLSLDASSFNSGLGTAQGKLNTFQQQAAKAASGAATAKAGAGQTPTTLTVAVEPAQLQAALKAASTGIQTVHVPIDVDARSIAAMRTKITQGLGVIPVQISAQFPKSGPNSPQAIIGTVFSSLGGVSPQKGQTLARQAIEQILPKRAHGGPVSSGRPVVVGDGGRPEVFRPGATGFIERDVAEYRRRAAELAALEYQIQQRQGRIQHALKGARVPMLPPGSSMPPALGTAPLREGYVRGYHRTSGSDTSQMAANLASIRRGGLQMSKTQGHLYGEPDMNWFTNTPYESGYAVEAHLPSRWFGMGRRPSDPYTIGGPSSNMGVGRNVSPRRFASHLEPWMHHTRYMEERAGEESPGRVMRQIGSTISGMRGDSGYEDMTQGYDQFVANSWRARHRARGGGVYRSGGAPMQPVACPSCKLVNWSLMSGAPRKSCFKCGSPLSMKAVARAGGGEVNRYKNPEDLENIAIEHFGVTDNIREAGYLTPSGKFLDFSGRHESEGYERQGDRFVRSGRYGAGDPIYSHLSDQDYLAGQRGVDHVQASEILPGIYQGEAVEKMKSMGFIRVWGTSGARGGPLHTVGAEMTRLPTMAQINRLVGASRESLHAAVDVYDPMGYHLPEGSFATQWPEDPMGGKKMGSFIRQAIDVIQKNDAKAQELREEMSLSENFNPNMHRCAGGAVHANGGCRMAAGGEAKAAKAYGEWAVQHSLMMGGSGRIKVAPNEFAMVNRGNAVLDALTDIGQTRAATGMHRAFYDIERGKIESEAGKLGGVSGHQLVDVVAALSSNQPWDRNVAAGIQAIRAVQGQGPAGFANREQLEMVEAILAGKRVTGVKRLPFADAFYDPNAFPIDRWMGRITTLGMKTGIPAPKTAMELMQALRGKDWIGKDVPQPAVRRASIFTINELAKRRAIDPREAQAEPWGTIRDLNKEAVKYFRFDTKTGRAMPRASGGPVMASGPFAKAVFQTGADWASDPYMAMMAWQAQQQKQHRARGGRVARDFAGPPLAEVPARMSPWYKGDQDWLDIMSGEYGWGSQMAGYQRHITDEQWRGPEAGKPRVSLPGMQDEPEISGILRSMALARHQGRSIKGHAAGGPTGRGLYIINEQGDNSEGFVANKDAHLIPKFVMDRIPHARDGAQTGMINKPANSFFAPEQDGVIIPKWAVPYVGALRHAQAGFQNIGGVAVPPGTDPEDIRKIQNVTKAGGGAEATAQMYGYQTWAEHISEMARSAERAGPSRGRDIPTAPRRNIAQDLAEGRAGIGKELPSRTAQGAVASVASFLFGGVQQLGQAQVRRAQAEQGYSKSLRIVNSQLQTYKGTLTEYRDAIAAVGKTTEEGTALDVARTDYIARAKPKLQEAIALEKERGEALERADVEARPTQAGIVKNIGVIIAATSAYGMAMQAAGAIITPAVEGSVQALKDFGDQLGGFSTTGARVTKGLGEQLNQAGGNLDKVFGDVGLQTRMSVGFSMFLEKTLGGSVTAKAAAANQGQQSELFRAALGVGNNNVASGLYGGYGGVGGTSFLASQLGGGKGFMEQIAGDVSAFAGPRGGLNPEDLGTGLLFAQNQQFRDYVTGKAKEQGNPLGVAADIVGTGGDILRGAGPLVGTAAQFLFPKTGPSPQSAGGAVGFQNPALIGKGGADIEGITKYLENLGEEAKRGAQALGQVSKYSYQLAKDQAQLDAGTTAAAKSGDAYAVSMATNGVVLVDATGKVAQSAEDFQTTTRQMAKGATIPDMATYIQSQAQSLRAGFEMVAAQAAHQLEVGIPGQLGMQLAAQPFMEATAGVLPPGMSAADVAKKTGTVAGFDVGKTLADTQALQDQLAQQGRDALKELSNWIGSQPGMQGTYTSGQQTFGSAQEAFDSFTKDMGDAGAAITQWQTKIAGIQTQQQWAQFSNNLRLSNRAYADALALAGRGGGGRGSRGEMGGLERQQAMLGFGLAQKQINFQTALAGFQAPGLTSEERAARQAQAQAEAKVAQQQLNIQKREFTVGAGRGVEDTGAALKLLKSEQAAQTAIAAAQKAIAAQQIKLSQAQAKAQVVQMKAENSFTTVLQSAATYAGQFGGAVQAAVKTIYTSLGFSQTKSGRWVQTNPMPTVGGTSSGGTSGGGGFANGYLGRFARGATMTVGEAGPETVAILRNPTTQMMGGGGGGGPVTVNLNLTVQGDVSGDATIEKIVRAVEASFNRKAARLGMRGLVSATG